MKKTYAMCKEIVLEDFILVLLSLLLFKLGVLFLLPAQIVFFFKVAHFRIFIKENMNTIY